MIFLQTADNFILFPITKRKFQKFSNFRKKFEIVIFGPKNRQTGKTANFRPNLKKMNIIFGISDPKLVKKHTSQSMPFFFGPLCNTFKFVKKNAACQAKKCRF